MGKTKTVARRVEKADQRATHRAARRDDGPLLRAAGGASEVADQPPLIALSAATILIGAMLRRPAVVRSGVRMLASHALATGIKTVLKSSIDRTRPARALKEGHHAGKGDGADDSSLNSFPSGHTAGAVAVAEAAAEGAPVAVALPARLAAAGVAAVQPSRGKHYVSDVLAGAVIGWASERATAAVMRSAEAALAAGMARWRKG